MALKVKQQDSDFKGWARVCVQPQCSHHSRLPICGHSVTVTRVSKPEEAWAQLHPAIDNWSHAAPAAVV